MAVLSRSPWLAVLVGLFLLAIALGLGAPDNRLAWGLFEFGLLVFGDGVGLPQIANLAGMSFKTQVGDDERVLRLLYSAPRTMLRFVFAAVLAVFSTTVLFRSPWWDTGMIVGIAAYALLMLVEIIRAYREVTSRSS